MFGWYGDHLCRVICPSRAIGQYVVSFHPDTRLVTVGVTPALPGIMVYVIDRGRTCRFFSSGPLLHTVVVQDAFEHVVVPIWRVRRTDAPFSLAAYHFRRLISGPRRRTSRRRLAGGQLSRRAWHSL